jgi:crossover junction endodeoxyribonuclease RuvC
MRILGIDPGSHITGYGILEKKGGRLIHIDNGCLTTKRTDSMPDRLNQIYNGLIDIISRFRPDAMAIEEVFVARNPNSAIKLGESRGIALLAAVQQKVSVHEYSTRLVKQAITGYGQASKDQIQKMVKSLLALPQVAQEDASDALAIAICHANSCRINAVTMKGAA